MTALEIIYSDGNLIVINKPPGTAVHPGDSVRGETIADMLVRQFPEIRAVGDNPEERPGIVHRLDQDTSGVMVIAQTQESFEALKNLFKSRQVEKTYRAIVCGQPRGRAGIITSAIGRIAGHPLKRGTTGGRARIRGGREAITHYRVIKSGGGHSLLEIKPKTGRTHQIRVHLASIGHPVACDRAYGGKNVCCPAGCRRQLLHARSLSFSYPHGRKLFFEAGEPEDFRLALAAIRW